MRTVARRTVIAALAFASATPASADGGPHVATANSGLSTLAADSCAGCHRAHTARGEMLIAAASASEPRVGAKKATKARVLVLSLVAVCVDARSEEYLERFGEIYEELRREGHRMEVLFLEATRESLVRRYSETRRMHPLGELPDAIDREREVELLFVLVLRLEHPATAAAARQADGDDERQKSHERQ